MVRLPKTVAVVFLVFAAAILASWSPWRAARSANLTQASASLEVPRLSFFGRLHAGNQNGSSIVVLSPQPGTALDQASTTSANLFEGDRVLITADITSTAHEQYEVADPYATSSADLGVFTIATASGSQASALNALNSVQHSDVVASRSGSITATMTTVTGIVNPKVRVLIPKGTTSGSAQDGIPDRDGWDITAAPSTNIEYSCSSSPSYSASTTSIGTVNISGTNYHSFVCDFSGSTVPASTVVTVTIDETTAGGNAGYQGLINPSAKTSHTRGYADTYNFVFQELNASDTVIDQTSVGVAVIESVLVTASVAPQITFRLLGVGTGSALNCLGAAVPDVASTATLVPLGELSIDAFVKAAQELVVSTNAQNGYVVTAQEDNQLHRTDATCPGDANTGGCIPDATGDSATITHDTKGLWTSTTAKGFGYTLQSVNGSSTLAFTHADSDGGCSGANGNCWKHFADKEDVSTEAPQTLYSYNGPADSHSVYVCYKAIVSSTQQAGSDYSTGITYRATATF